MQKIIILDFGSQYTQLIARRIREFGVYAEIHPFSINQEQIVALQPQGIILSGGPASVYQVDAPLPNADIFGLNIPVLGICYGLQYIVTRLGGAVENVTERREYGRAAMMIVKNDKIFNSMPINSIVWMSHGDSVSQIPEDFEVIASSSTCPVVAIRNTEKKIYGVQFHPEVNHSEYGARILSNFVLDICNCQANWSSTYFIEESIKKVRATVGEDKVLCALSGGVDSTVLAVLLHKAIGKQLVCFHVDSGLMREEESETIIQLFKQNFDISIEIINAQEEFLTALAGVTDPEKKRKIIGKLFVDLFEREAAKFKDCKWLAQGTLYPDVIESISIKGPSQTIKSHHNVGGLPEKMNLKILEPFRELFKDEVRKIGLDLGVPDWFIYRHPFPGPGLGIRIIGEITLEKVSTLQKADSIFLEELHNFGIYNNIWQAFAVLLPVKSVGVMGDERTYEDTCVIRAVSSVDGMTADWYPLPYEVLSKISSRITNEVRGINRVVYDITSKPPGTIEWE